MKILNSKWKKKKEICSQPRQGRCYSHSFSRRKKCAFVWSSLRSGQAILRLLLLLRFMLLPLLFLFNAFLNPCTHEKKAKSFYRLVTVLIREQSINQLFGQKNALRPLWGRGKNVTFFCNNWVIWLDGKNFLLQWSLKRKENERQGVVANLEKHQ